MEVVLKQTVQKLGERGHVVKVADGYARNYLLPKGIAILATKGARRQAEDMQRAESRREQRRRDAANVERERLHGRNITVRARANAQGHLYGSVTAREIVEALRETHGIVIDADRCQLAEHLRTVDSHTVRFGFYKDIAAEVTVTVKALEGSDQPEPATADVQKAPKPKPIIVSDSSRES
ncbi:MAG: 50S ribosomal protein L9 [Fimbriimonadaceae bacterium]|nr:50S ribosomal protein L9 [Fimbriimonadaceae bacterium]